MALKLGALSWQRVPSSNGNGRLMKFPAKTLCGLRNSHQRRAQVAFNVHRERFARRNVYYVATPSSSGDWAKHQSVGAPQKCGKRFTGSRGSEDQRGFIACDRRPAGALRTRGRGKNRFEPIAHRRMKKFKLAGRLLRRRGFVVLRHFDQPKLLSPAK